MKILLKGLNKADVLAALYNASKPQGMGMMHYNPTPMTRETAEQLLKEGTYFDYLQGRVMKINLSGDELDVWGYDRDNGEGAAERALSALRETGDANTESIQSTHTENTLKAAEDVMDNLDKETTLKGNTLTLGLSDVAHHLRPATERVIRDRESHQRKN